MLNFIKNLQTKEWFTILLLMLIITDLIIILDLPILRDSIPFLFFTVIPGFLIILILKLNNIEFIKKTLLSIGLSISILLGIGLLLNNLYPLLSQPLTLTPVLLTLNIITIILIYFAYYGNNDINISSIFNFQFNLEDKLLYPIIFPVLFPLMAVIGTYLMNTSVNNIILITMLFLIPLYLFLVVYHKDKIHPITYPIALFMIGMGLILMHSLTSFNILGRDVHQEFYVFQLTFSNYHWNIDDFYNPYNACLSISILPTIYYVLTYIKPEYIFKLLFALIGSILPLIIFSVAKKYMNIKYAFFAPLLFVFQVFFINIVGAIRQEIAIIFFFLAVMVLFDTFGNTQFENSWTKKILFLILVFSMIISHYTTSYVALVILIPILLLPFIKNLYINHKFTTINFDVLIIYFGFIILWFILYAKVQFLAGSEVIQSTLAATVAATDSSNGALGFVNGRESTVLSVLGIGIKNVPNLIAVIVNDLIFATIGIGLITMLVSYHKTLKDKTKLLYNEIIILDSKIVLASLLSFMLLAMFLLLPSVSFFYGSDRLFFQLLIFTAPIFIIGTLKIAKLINKIVKKPDFKMIIVMVLIFSLFICNTHIQYEFSGIPFSPEYDKIGTPRGELYIHDGELAASKWIENYHYDDIRTYSDAVGFTRLYITDPKFKFVGINFNNKTINGYIYMGNANINEGKLYDSIDTQVTIKKYSYFFINKNRIYDAGYGQIWV